MPLRSQKVPWTWQAAFAGAVLSCMMAHAAAAQCAGETRQLVAAGELTAARAASETALRASPASDSLMHCLGVIAYASGDQGAAAQWFERAIAANDRVSTHHVWLGRTLAQQVSTVSKLRLPFVARRMRNEFERAAALDSTSVEAHEGLMGYYLNAPGFFGGSVDKARSEATAIVRLNAMRGHLDLAAVALRQHDSTNAERELRAAGGAAPPDSAAAVIALVTFLVEQQRWPEAFDVCTRGMQSFPSIAALRLLYGRAAALSGQNLERGEHELTRWMSDGAKEAPASTRAAAHVRLGAIYQLQGRIEAARAEYESALSLVRGYPEAVRALRSLPIEESYPNAREHHDQTSGGSAA